MKYIFDLDDYDDSNNVLPRLLELKKMLPNLKVNLFTIPFKISDALVEETAKYNWIQMIPHGFYHETNYECAKLNDYSAPTLFNSLISWPNLDKLQHFQCGFKAPGWQISEAVMRWLKSQGWWVAVQWSDGRFEGDVNGPYQPKVIEGLKYYALNEVDPTKYIAIHGHTWECCGNGLEALWQRLIALPEDAEFEFINDFVKDTFDR